jgi:putative transferase (TIGR04331 family)
MFLITTANQKYWKTDEKVLFLGEWCKPYEEKKIWSQIDHEILPFFWSDRTRQAQGIGYINKLYEHYLKIISKQLNEIHQVNHRTNYWRIIVGPWLFYFLIFLYDRYLSIRSAIDSGKVTNTWIIQKPDLSWTPKDYTTFYRWSATQADYNLCVYSRLIETLGGIPYEIKNEPLNLVQGSYDPKLKGVKYLLKTFLQMIGNKMPDRCQSIVFFGSFFHFSDLLRLQLNLRQTPTFFSPMPIVPAVTPDTSLRNGFQFPESINEFEKIAESLIPLQMPTAYLESYSYIKQESQKYYPKKPELILTANGLFDNEGFKFWTAHHTSQGCKLAGIQHGGGYGSRKVDSVAYNEIRACDRYYTWGWDLKGHSKVRPLPAGKLLQLKNITPNPKGDILLLSTGEPPYSRWDHGEQMGSEIKDYLKEQDRFFQSLSLEAQSLLLFRLYPEESYGKQLHEFAPTLRLDHGKNSMIEQLKQSRLSVCTNNGTTVLETLAANFPTLIFSNFKRSALRRQAKPYYDQLMDVGILHETPESAAQKTNEIFENPMEWWNEPVVQNAVKTFCTKFALVRPNGLRDWKEELLALCKEK